MSLLRPTLQGRKGYNPTGFGPGVNAPFGRNKAYRNGQYDHHGQDYFWCSPATEKSLGLKTGESQNVYPVKDGNCWPVDDPGLGIGVYQYIEDDVRIYYWHLSRRIYNEKRYMTTKDRVGIMGHTGTSAGSDTHLHLEVRKAPYRAADRVDPEPYFKKALAGNQRKVVAAGANKRQKPNTSAKVVSTYGPGEIKTFQGYVKAPALDGTRIETVNGNGVWFVTGDGYFTHASGYTDSGTKGLTDITSKLFPKPPVPPKPTTPTPEPEPEPIPIPEPEEPIEVPGPIVEPEPVPVEPPPVQENPNPVKTWIGIIGGVLAVIVAAVVGVLAGRPPQ